MTARDAGQGAGAVSGSDVPRSAGGASASTRTVLGLGAVVLTAWALLAALRPGLLRAIELFPLDLPANPYFVPGHALLLYAVVPAWTVALVVATLAPGFLALLCLGGAPSIPAAWVRAFGLAFVLRLVVHAAGIAFGLTWSAAPFVAAEIGLTAVLWALLLARVARGYPVAWPLARRGTGRSALWMIALPVVVLLPMLPQFLWQDMNADGFELLEIGRSLSTNFVPRYLNNSGFQGLGLGMMTAAYPVHWLVSLIGPVEAAARLPLLVFLTVIFAAVIALSEWQSPRRLRPSEEALVGLLLFAFVITMGFNASYDPYTGDFAAPLTIEALGVLFMASALFSLWRSEPAWFVGYALLAHFTRPNGFFFILLLAVAVVAAPREKRRQWAILVAAAIAACLIGRFVYEDVFVPWASGGLSAGYASSSILERLAFLTFTDVRRLLFLVVPCGILPALGLLAFRRHDALARMLAVVCLGYFALFYVIAFTSLHHFVPVMILPAVVWARLVLRAPPRRAVTLAWGAGLVIAAILALPRSFEVYRVAREIGSRTVYRMGDYGSPSLESRQLAIRSSEALRELFPTLWPDESAEENLFLVPIGIVHYAWRYPIPVERADYVVQPADAEAPPGFTYIGTRLGGAAFVRDSTTWRNDRTRTPRIDYQSRFFAIGPETLYSWIGIRQHNYDLSLWEVPLVWRLLPQ